MKFEIKKCTILIINKRERIEGTEQHNQEKIKTFTEKEIYIDQGILQMDTIKKIKIKERSASEEKKK